MIITHKFDMAVDRRGPAQIVDAVQGESNTRVVQISLYTTPEHNKKEPWVIPDGVSPMIRFRKKDGTGGIYDVLPDGSDAVTLAGNVITAVLAPQMLTVPGAVLAQVELTAGAKSMATFTFHVEVQPDPSVGAMESKDYYNLRKYVYEEIKKFFDDDTPTTAMTVTFSGNANSGYKADKTFSEVSTALSVGLAVIGVLKSAALNIVLDNVLMESEQGYCSFNGQARRYAGGEAIPIESWTAILHSGDTVEVFSEDIVTGETIGNYLFGYAKKDELPKLYEVTITVSDGTETVAVTGLSLDLTSYSAKVGGEFYINPVVSPTNATNKAVTWKSSATNIATVDSFGHVICISKGNAVITCTTVDGGFTATCAVSVSAESGGETEVTLSSISATYSGGDVAVGTSVTDLTGIVVTAHYSDGSTATVTGYTLSGTIAEGSNTIAVSYGGKTTTFAVMGVAESTDGKVQFSTLERTTGGIKADGTAHTLGSTYHVILPYTEGMLVRTVWNTGWSANTYPAILVVNGGTYTIPDYDTLMKDDGSTKDTITIGGKIGHMCEATLTGFASGSEVIVNMFYGSDPSNGTNSGTIEEQMDKSDYLYYIPGGEN